ncbi:MAG TPA: hypothetical protein VF482_01155, partial [Trebonia sp.]
MADFAAPPAGVAARQVQRWVLFRVEQAGDQAEQLRGLFGAAVFGHGEHAVLDDPDRDGRAVALARRLQLREIG